MMNRPEFKGDFKDFVSDLRYYLFPSMGKAAEYFGFNHSTISRYEDGKIQPDVGYLACLARLIVDKLDDKDEKSLEAYRRILLQHVNKAITSEYHRSKSFKNWDNLCEVAEKFLARKRGNGDYHSQDWGQASEMYKEDPNPVDEETPAESSHDFFPGHPIDYPRYFFGRESELKRIFGYLDRPLLMPCIAIIGPSQSGQTSLLNHIKWITRTPREKLRSNQRLDWLKEPANYQLSLTGLHFTRHGRPMLPGRAGQGLPGIVGRY